MLTVKQYIKLAQMVTNYREGLLLTHKADRHLISLWTDRYRNRMVRYLSDRNKYSCGHIGYINPEKLLKIYKGCKECLEKNNGVCPSKRPVLQTQGKS